MLNESSHYQKRKGDINHPQSLLGKEGEITALPDRAGDLLLLTPYLLIFLFIEPDGDAVAIHRDGPLDQPPVGGQQVERLRLGHALQLILNIKFLILYAAGVEQFFEFAVFQRFFQDRFRRRRFGDVKGLIRQLVRVQEFMGLAAGTAFIVSVKFHDSPLRQGEGGLGPLL